MSEDTQTLDIDTLFVKHLGQFGNFQKKAIVFLGFATIFSAFNSWAFVFTTARISSRCRVPECDDDGSGFSPPWILNAVPGTNADSVEQCSRYKYNNITISSSNETGVCPALLFDQNVTIKCDSGVIYENDNSIVNDFDLGCNEWQRSLVGTIKNVGTLIGCSIMGIMADRIGRRQILILNIFSAGCMGIIRYWANSYTVFVIFDTVESFLAAGCFECCYVLTIENVGPDYREIAGACAYFSMFIGNGLLSLFAWSFPDWRNLTLVLYAPQIIIISYYWLVPESIRWLLSKKHFDEAEKTVKILAQSNGKTVSESILLQLQHSTNVAKKENKMGGLQKQYEPSLIRLVFKENILLLRCLVVPIWWITLSFVYQGLLINAINLSGDKYLNFFIVSLVDVPGFLSATFLTKIMGRRVLLAVCYFSCSLCLIGNIFVDSGSVILSLVLYLVGKYTIGVVGPVLYIYTTELFPTNYRQSLFGYCSMIGRVGAIAAPITPALSATIWPKLPFVIYGGLALLSSCLTFLTPETKGTKLPDTIEDILRKT